MPVRLSKSPEHFPFVNNLFLQRMMDSKLFWKKPFDPPRLMWNHMCSSIIWTGVLRDPQEMVQTNKLPKQLLLQRRSQRVNSCKRAFAQQNMAPTFISDQLEQGFCFYSHLHSDWGLCSIGSIYSILGAKQSSSSCLEMQMGGLVTWI